MDPDERAYAAPGLTELLGDLDAWRLPDRPTDGDWSEFPADPLNPITDAKVSLGRALFHDTGLAAAGADETRAHTWSCSTCHAPAAGFRSGTTIGRGIAEGGVGTFAERRVVEGYAPGFVGVDLAPFSELTVINVAYRARISGWQGEFDSVTTTSDGQLLSSPGPLLPAGFEGLEAFVYGALVTHRFWPIDDILPETSVLSAGSGMPDHDRYVALFATAFAELPPEERITHHNVALALAAFVRTIVADDAPFQALLRDPDGPSPMSDAAMAGATIFFGVGRCTACHLAPGLNGNTFEVLGTGFVRTDDLVPEEAGGDASVQALLEARLSDGLTGNQGRANTTNEDRDRGAFAVASVYGAGSPAVRRWGHGGAHTSLRDFLRHKTGGWGGDTIDRELAANLSPVLFDSHGAFLTEDQLASVEAFITEGLEDPELEEKYGELDW